jgi:TATA-box binding protein (TBP) (component of TFIID and TFIIIB)
MVILDIGHPSIIAEVETTVELTQLVLQIIKCNINVELEKIWFPAVVYRLQLGGCFLEF